MIGLLHCSRSGLLPKTVLLAIAAALSCCIGSTSRGRSAPAAYKTEYERYVCTRPYPRILQSYMDDELMQQAKNGARLHLYICLEQQRGRLYVGERLAADWPVSTGTTSHSTPIGTFRVLEKDIDHVSKSYGRIVDAAGKVVNNNATPGSSLPPGGAYEGAPMPYFLRLTPQGVGIHSGAVKPGVPLSHGCIRTPLNIAAMLYEVTKVGTPVTVTKGVEACYPLLQSPRKTLK